MGRQLSQLCQHHNSYSSAVIRCSIAIHSSVNSSMNAYGTEWLSISTSYRVSQDSISMNPPVHACYQIKLTSVYCFQQLQSSPHQLLNRNTRLHRIVFTTAPSLDISHMSWTVFDSIAASRLAQMSSKVCFIVAPTVTTFQRRRNVARWRHQRRCVIVSLIALVM